MVGMLSDIGNYRKVNQDSVGYYEEENKRFYVIADGMGGHNAGEIASKLAIKVTIEYIKQNLQSDDIERHLHEAVKKANSKIFEYAKRDESLKGMGTTITACYIYGNKAAMANVGDSSGIVIIDGDIKKITKDHSLVQQLVDIGDITEEAAKNHPNKNIITRALGTDEDVNVDIFELDLKGINKIVLCTDGLTNKVSLSEIYDIINNYEDETCCQRLIDLSKSKDSRDNISVIVFEGECRNDRNYTWE